MQLDPAGRNAFYILPAFVHPRASTEKIAAPAKAAAKRVAPRRTASDAPARVDDAFELVGELEQSADTTGGEAGPVEVPGRRAPFRITVDLPCPEARQIVRDHMLGAAGVGLLPFPIVDVAVMAGIQVNMMRGLARYYGKAFSYEHGSWVVTALAGSTALGVASIVAGGSLAKLVPGVGSAVGAATLSISAGAMTYALGHVVALFFEKGGDFTDFVIEEHSEIFRTKLQEGEREAWKASEPTG